MIDRSTYIGGGDAGAILGRNQYQTLYQTWAKKVGLETDDIDNAHIVRGNTMEPLIEDYVREHLDPTVNEEQAYLKYGRPGCIAAYKEWATHKTGPPPQIFVRHKKFDWAGGHPDGVGRKIVWEFKAPAPRNFDWIERQGVSESWVCQVQYYMWITGIEEGRIAIWNFNTWSPLVIRIRADKKLWRQFEQVFPEFWECVQNRTEPSISPYTDKINFVSDEFFDDILVDYQNATNEHYRGKDTQKTLKALIVSYMNGNESLQTDDFYVTAKEQSRYGNTFIRLTVRPRAHA